MFPGAALCIKGQNEEVLTRAENGFQVKSIAHHVCGRRDVRGSFANFEFGVMPGSRDFPRPAHGSDDLLQSGKCP